MKNEYFLLCRASGIIQNYFSLTHVILAQGLVINVSIFKVSKNVSAFELIECFQNDKIVLVMCDTTYQSLSLVADWPKQIQAIEATEKEEIKRFESSKSQKTRKWLFASVRHWSTHRTHITFCTLLPSPIKLNEVLFYL